MSYEAREGEVPPINGPTQFIPPYEGRPQLFIEEGTNDHLLYRIGNNWYDAVTLTPNRVPLGTMRLQYLMDINLEEYSSHPVYVALRNNWNVFSSNGVQLISHPGAIPFNEPSDDQVESVTPLLIPARSLPVVSTGPFQRAQLPLFNPVWMERLTDLANNNLPLSDIELFEITTGSPNELLLVQDELGRPWYLIDGNLYGIQSLMLHQDPSPVRTVENITNFQIQSQPILVEFNRGWSIYHTPENQVELIASTAEEPSRITNFQIIPVPALPASFLPGTRGLLQRSLPAPNPEVIGQLTTLFTSSSRTRVGEM